MNIGDLVIVKDTGKVETIEDIKHYVGYGRYGLWGVTLTSITTERGVYEAHELEPLGKHVQSVTK